MRTTKGDVGAKRAVSQFLAIAPRDVRAPLQGVRVYAAALEGNATSDTLGGRWISMARLAGERAT